MSIISNIYSPQIETKKKNHLNRVKYRTANNETNFKPKAVKRIRKTFYIK